MAESEHSNVTINDDDILYRRFYRLWRDESGENLSSVFMKHGTDTPDPEISVDLARLTTPEETQSRSSIPGLGVAELTVGDVRKLGFTVRYEPDQEQGNLAHCIIEGAKTEADCDALAAIARVRIPSKYKSKPRRPQN